MSDVAQINFHLRGRSKVFIKNGKAKKLYISARGADTTFDASGLRAQDVFVNVSNGTTGSISVNPLQNFFKIGTAEASNISSVNSTLKTPEPISVIKHKVKRFFKESLPGYMKKTIRATLLVGGLVGVCTVILAAVLMPYIAGPVAGSIMVVSAINAINGTFLTAIIISKKRRAYSF